MSPIKNTILGYASEIIHSTEKEYFTSPDEEVFNRFLLCIRELVIDQYLRDNTQVQIYHSIEEELVTIQESTLLGAVLT